MMRKILLFINIFITFFITAQNLSSNENYTYSRTYLEPVTVSQPNAKQIQGVNYFDGLGKSKQSVAIKGSPNGKDLIIHAEYDSNGRQTKNYLPLPIDTQNGAYQANISSNEINSYYGVPNAYSEISLEKSPLRRIERSASPGTDWQISGNHTKKTEYKTNVENSVKKYRAITTWNPTTQLNDISVDLTPDDGYTTNGFYNVNTLFRYISIDEDGNHIETYTNSSNQKILVRQINKKTNGITENLDTYYVYDIYGNLSLIIPPKAAITSLLPAVVDNLCYQYKYDKFNRLAEKKLPGAGWIYIVYDKQDRPILMQDANLRNINNNFQKKGWIFTKYDKFGRTLYTGFFSNTSTRLQMQTAVNNMSINTLNNESYSTTPFSQNGIDVYYSKAAFPTGSMTILNVNYFDKYPPNAPGQPSQIKNQITLQSSPTNYTSNGISSVRSTKSLPTAGYVKNVENDSWSSTFIWYDNLGRVIGSNNQNHLGGFTNIESLLDFSGKTIETNTNHSKNTSNLEFNVKDRYVYNAYGFIAQHYQKINSNPEELLTDYNYNDLGQIINKKVGNNLQNIDYQYNIRGWLTGINSDKITNLGSALFAYKIKYNSVDGAESPNNFDSNLKVKPKYNGGISEADWKTAAGSNEPLRRYGYVYDGADRVRAGLFQIDTNPYSKEYSEIIDYDLNGNISTLHRTGSMVNSIAEVMDDLTYSYDGNKLSYIEESGSGNALSGYPLAIGKGITINYDANGNMVNHLDKGITSISYNFLNLPISIKNTSNSEVKFIYTSAGVKARKIDNNEITDYLGNFQYTVSNGIQTSFVLINEEGYFDFVNNRYVYQYKDHLGNIRISYTRNQNGVASILEENNYYTFGLKHSGYNSGDLTNNKYKHLYNGKELQSNGNLDYGWRHYMPDLGRWGNMDQLSEAYHYASPYAYVLNNPSNMLDPDGRLTQAQIDYMWNNSGQGYTSWTFNPDGSPRVKSYSYMDSSMVQSIISSIYAAAGGSGGGGGGGGGFGGGFGGGTGGFGGYTAIRFWTGDIVQNSFRVGNEIHTNADYGVMHEIRIYSDNSTNNSNFFSNYQNTISNGDSTNKIWPHVIGPGLTGLGMDVIPKRFLPKIGMRGFVPPGVNSNTSIASVVLRKIIPKSWPRVSFLPKAASLGGQLGRVVPIVGIATTIWDYAYNFGPWVAEQWMNIIPQHQDAFPDDRGWMMESGVCFKAGTLVLGNNNFLRIEDIKEGDFVLSYNERLKKTQISKVRKVVKRFTDQILKIEIGNEVIFVTKEHPFYVEKKGWTKAENLQLKDIVKRKDGISEVNGSETLHEKTTVYNIEVSGNHNYFITNSQILVHNKKIKLKKETNGK